MAENIRNIRLCDYFVFEIQNRMNVEIKENKLTPKQYGMSLKRRKKK